MIEQKHIDELNKLFEYKKDEKFSDGWKIVAKNWKGDCEDYALTLLWLSSDKKMHKFIKNVLNSKIRFHYVKYKDWPHFVLQYEHSVIDNIQRKLIHRDDPKIHKSYVFVRTYPKYEILIKMFVSKIWRTVGK